MSRTVVSASAPVTLNYVSSGSPTGDGSLANPFDSAQSAYYFAQGNLDLAGLPGTPLTIQGLAGTTPQIHGEILNGPILGQRDATSILVNGNSTSPISYDTRTAAIVAFGINYGAKLSVAGFHMQTGQANIAVDGPGSHLIISGYMAFDTTQDHHISSTNGSKIDRVANYDVFSGGAGSHLNIYGAGNITVPLSGLVVTIKGNSLWFYSGFASVSGPGTLSDSNTTYAGYNTWGPRAIITGGGYANTGSATPTTHFPGSTPAQYTTGYLV